MRHLFRRVLVPHDFSEHATRALKLAAELAASRGGRLIVLYAIAPFQPVTGFPAAEETAWIPPADLVAQERRHLEALVSRTLPGSRVPVECRVVIGDPFRRILDAALGADSIVMATAGRSGLSHLLIGSVAEKVVRHAPVPVLTLRPAVARAAARTPARAPAGRKRTRATRRS